MDKNICLFDSFSYEPRGLQLLARQYLIILHIIQNIFYSVNARFYSSGAGSHVLQNWIKIAVISRLLIAIAEIANSAQICRSVCKFQNLSRETDLENEGHTQVRENCICAGSLTANKTPA